MVSALPSIEATFFKVALLRHVFALYDVAPSSYVSLSLNFSQPLVGFPPVTIFHPFTCRITSVPPPCHPGNIGFVVSPGSFFTMGLGVAQVTRSQGKGAGGEKPCSLTV